MKISALKGLPATSAFRDTQHQDAAVTESKGRPLGRYAVAGALLLAVFVWLAHAWGSTQHLVSRDLLRTAAVTRGDFVSDVAARGTVIAAVKPTLFAIAAGTITYAVRAGDTVTQGQVLAVLDSPELTNDFQRERATLDSLNAALAHQEIEIRRQLLTGKQQADLAQVAINAAERELKRAQWAWAQHAMSERDYQRSIDDVATAKLNFEHARDTAALERESVALDLRTRRLDRDRQALVVAERQQKIAALTVRSPVAGMVGDLAQAQKAKLAESAPLLTVVDLSAFEIEFQVAETYAGQIKICMPAEITLGGRMERGLVTAISPEVRDNQVTGRVRFNSGQVAGLRQNERASVRIVLDQRERVLKFERGGLIDETTRALYVLRNDRAQRVSVELGAASVSEIEVLGGLAKGDAVIISDTRDFNNVSELAVSH
jgi:HlyD family secretion protein